MTRPLALEELVSPCPTALAKIEIRSITQDSRAIGAGTLFFAIRGSARDGHDFIASSPGAACYAVNASHPRLDAIRRLPHAKGRLLEVVDTRVALAEAACRFHGSPSNRLIVCGVTGTNGKTTSTYLLEALLREWGKNPAVIGTVENRLGAQKVPSTHTTPDAVGLQKLLLNFVELGATAVAMEVSSHALDQRRTGGMRFDAALFTNLTQDHLDYHRTLEDYYAAKARLFLEYPVKVRAIHADDPYGARLAAECVRRGLSVVTFGRTGHDVNYEGLRLSAAGIEGELAVTGDLARARGSETAALRVRSRLLGAFNAQNVAGAAAVGLGLGIPFETISKAIAGAPQVPGRMESIANSRGLTVIVDYAHTPDALENVLRTARGLCRGKLVCVFGCGGDRDPGKRPQMGAIAEELAHWTVVTSDNPRTENPEAIVEAILRGFKSRSTAHVELDRRKAIAAAIHSLKPGDIALIAGKGHEDYQIIGEAKLPFDDRAVAAENLK